MDNKDNNRLWPKHVDQTVKQIQSFYINGSINGITKCVAEFYSKCSNESLRAATMDLIIKTHKLFSTIKDADSSLVIETILLEFEQFLKQKNGDEKFVNDVINATVSQNLWDKSFKISVYQDATKCSAALDLLFHIRQPETEKRKTLIKLHVGKLLEKENTVNNGNEWIKIFAIDIAVNDDEPISKYVQKQLLPMLERKKRGKKDDDENEKLSDASTKFFSSYSPQLLKSTVMKLILKTFELTADKDVKDIRLIFGIYKSVETFLDSKDEQFVKEVTSAKVEDDLWITVWEKCFKASFKRSVPKWFSFLNLIFKLSAPESEKRRLFIEGMIQKSLEEKTTFGKAVGWISILNLEGIIEKNFENIVLNPLIFKNRNPFNIFPTVDAKLRCLRILDNVLIRAESNTLRNELEEGFIEAITVEKLPRKICKLMNTFHINIEELNFHACRSVFQQKIKLFYGFLDRSYFELYVLEALKEKDEKYKLDFLHIISDDQKYAYCWAKHLQIQSFPEFLQNCEHYQFDADEFVEKISVRLHAPVDQDLIEECQFWKKSYKLITVITPEALNNFVNEYLLKADVVGIDCEADFGQSKITVLQLATIEWICLIDIHKLYQKLSQLEWMDFFEKLFDPNIMKIGFSFFNDFRFICNRFPYLQAFFQDEARKVFCLQRFTHVLKTMNFDVFHGKKLKNGGLAALSKAVLDIEMDKSLQKSDWIRRPLTQFQKIYAVTDALVVVLIKNEIEKRLNEEFGIPTTSIIMEQGYIIYKINQNREN